MAGNGCQWESAGDISSCIAVDVILISDSCPLLCMTFAPHILAPYEKNMSDYATASLKDHRVQIKVDSHITHVAQD